MGRHRTFTIEETQEELESYKHTITDYKLSQKLNALFLIKSEKYKKLEEVALHLEIHIATLQRWLKIYKEEGISTLLSPETRNKPSKFITPEIHKDLESRLESPDNPFSSYVEVQQWLLEVYNVKMDYKWLWAYMTTKMNATLKVPRKVNINKAEDAEESFFKTT